MNTSSYCRREPPAPVRNHADAIRLISAAVRLPLVDETLAVLLDHRGRGNTLVSVSGTYEPDAVFDVADCMSAAGALSGRFTRLVLATVRPDDGLLGTDIDRWMEISQRCEGHGVTLVEWYVVHPDGIDCPRELLGEPPRW
jgi:hypothetical protein